MNFRVLLITVCLVTVGTTFFYFKHNKEVTTPKLKVKNSIEDKKYQEYEIPNQEEFFDTATVNTAVKDYVLKDRGVAIEDYFSQIECTPTYTFHYMGKYWDYSPANRDPQIKGPEEMRDPLLIEFTNSMNNQWDKEKEKLNRYQRIYTVARCTTTTGKQIVSYDHYDKQSAKNNQALVTGYLSPDNSVTNSIDISKKENDPFFKCNNVPVAYTNEDIAYFICGSVEELSRTISLYEAQYEKRRLEELFKCTQTKDSNVTLSYKCQKPVITSY